MKNNVFREVYKVYSYFFISSVKSLVVSGIKSHVYIYL